MIDELFATIDAKDAQRFAAYFAPHGQLRFANLPTAQGREQVEAFVTGFFDSIQALSHEIIASWDVPEGHICHGNVTYTRHDGSQLTVPFAVIIGSGKQGFEDYLIFADTSALYAA